MNLEFRVKNLELRIKKKYKAACICFYSLFSILYSLFLPTPAWAATTPLGTFQGVGGYEPAVSQNPTEAGIALADLLSNAIGFLTITSGIFFIFYFIIGALKWILAGGKPDKVQQAQDTMTHAAIGLIIVAMAYTIVFIVGQVLGINILQPVESILKLGPRSGQALINAQETTQQAESIIDQVLNYLR
ncbi:hypothetical protein A2160_00705 [Candidatus Beckwithbacteria bacterium RBG_13_42_9]|uniref:Uncharacterized protein n=1 Tax=Candidatus Beckwithbacteria bacterium RBG_13_42_9 TaxID=1797457 RepID=A0A1F5E4Q1_9BACT|nr:MAG: hypothetical protein A2160_00705 [Candidatus Beckwithbacteria bacterium RBG_13_42_9]